MKYIEKRTLTAYNLRKCCIENGWYTCGTVEEYQTLFDRLPYDEYGDPEHITTEKIAELAEDIRKHSERLNYGMTATMFEIAKWCDTHFGIA